MIFDTTTSTGHRITVEPEGEGAFAVAVNGSVTDVSSKGLGTLEMARAFAVRRAAMLVRSIEADARFMKSRDVLFAGTVGDFLDDLGAQVLTLTEAAALLGLSPSTLRVQVRNGKLRARKVGRDWTVSEREVERYRVTSKGRHAASSAKS